MRRRDVALGAAGMVLAGAAVWTGTGADAETRRPPAAEAGDTAARVAARPKDRLQGFASCAAFSRHAAGRAAALVDEDGFRGYEVVWRGGRGGGTPEVFPSPMPATGAPASDSAAPAAPAEGVDYSGTNVQEQGVDEPDLVVTDGRHVFTVAAGALRAVRIGDDPREVGRLALEGEGGDPLLLRVGDRLLIISRAWEPVRPPVPLPGPADVDRGAGDPSAPVASSAPIMPAGSGVVIVRLVDVARPGAMRLLQTLRLEGEFVGARGAGGTVRLVLRTSPDPVVLDAPADDTAAAAREAAARNRRAVAAAPARTWLPTMTLSRAGAPPGRERLAVRCRDVRRPTSFSGLGTLSVLTIDPARGLEPVDRDAVMTDGEIVYGSRGSLYVSTPRWVDPSIAGEEDLPPGGVTQIHRFDTSAPAATRYRASGRVPGYLLSQWAMSEHDGRLRVASTSEPGWVPDGGRPSVSRVSVLEERDGRLVTVGRVGGLGEGERIYAVRFIGDLGYVVTFRQTDPLYVVDLSRPTAPVVRGELKIPGYSAYLHPVGEDLLLGVGQDADAQGRTRGTQVSLFDVADPARPRRIHNLTLPGSWSEAESDHHAFLYWAPTRLAVIPVAVHSGDAYGTRALGVRVGRAEGITRVGAVAHPSSRGYPASIRRALVMDRRLVTLSDQGLAVDSLDGLRRQAFLPLG